MCLPADTAAPPEAVLMAHVSRARLIEERAEELTELLGSFDDPQPLRIALIDALSMAQATVVADGAADRDLANLALERHLVALVIEACRSEPESSLTAFVTAVGGLEHIHHAEEVMAARRAFTRRRRLRAGDRTAFLARPVAHRPVLAVAADGYEGGLHLDEALIFRERLARAAEALSACALPPEAQGSCRQLLSAARRALRGLDASLRRTPQRVDADPDQLQTLTALSLLSAREFSDPRAAERLRVAGLVSAVCTSEMRRLGVRAFDARLLLTSSRHAFNALIAPDRRAHRVQGAYYPFINTVVLAPGHSALMCQPDERYPLYPVHVHELAHASACNTRRVSQCDIEREMAEGYAEKVVAEIQPVLAARLSELHGRQVIYRESDAYRRQMSAIERCACLADITDAQLLAELSRTDDMVGHLAGRALGVSRELAAERFRRFLSGDDAALAG